jgi:hypothetical protein
MKKFLNIVCCISVCLGVQAQTDKDSSIKKAAVSICNCLEKNHIEDAKDQAEMQSVFLQCMLDSASFVMGDILTNAENGDYAKAGEEFGQKIAMELVKSGCKPFIQMSMKLSQGGGNLSFGNLGEDNDKESSSVKTIDGVVTKVEEKDFLYITLKSTAGREVTLIYLDYVDNSDDWVKDAATKLKDKNVTVQYVEEEMYMPKLKDFANVKKLKDLKIKKG